MAKQSVVVVGGGLVGLCSAYFLSEAGYAVEVIEREDEVGLATSFANAGMMTPSMSDPWNTPGILGQVLRGMASGHSPLTVRLPALWQYLGWGLRFLRYSAPERHRVATEANFRLSAYSVEQVPELRESLALGYDLGTRGTMRLYRDPASLAAAADSARHLARFGLMHEILDRDGVVGIEPLLEERRDSLAGGILYPGDETGDAHKFCRGLRAALERRGVGFRLNTVVRSLRREGGRVRGVELDREMLAADAVVVAAAAWSPALLDPLGIRLSIRPVKGYSLTVPLANSELMPKLSLIDDHLHAAVTPLGDRIRMAGTAELAGWDPRLRAERLQKLWDLAAAVSPAMVAALDRDAARAWCGFRPMAADGNPYIGATPIDGLWVNTGQGYLGWTQAVGSGQLLAQLMRGEEPAIDMQPYRVMR